MSNSLYNLGRQSFLEGDISWLTDNIKVVLIDTSEYTVDLTTDQFLSDIDSEARIATSSNLSGKTSTSGVADADDLTVSSVSGSVDALVIYKDTGSAATSNLIAYIDAAAGIPANPGGGNVTITWANTNSKIFKL